MSRTNYLTRRTVDSCGSRALSAAMAFAAVAVRADRIPVRAADATRWRDVRPSAARCLAPRQSALRPAVARSRAKSRKVRRDRLPSCSVRPHRREGVRRHGARCLEAVHLPRPPVRLCAAATLRRGGPRSGPGCPGRRRIATATPSCLGAPDLHRASRVAHGNVTHRSNTQAGRTLHPSSAHHQRNLLSSPCRQRPRDGLSWQHVITGISR